MQMNIWKIIYLNCGEDMNSSDWSSQLYMHTTFKSSCTIKAWKISGLNGIQTHTGAVLYQLSYQAIWELVTLWVRDIAIEGEECKWIYERSHIWTVEKDMKSWLVIVIINFTTA